MGLLKQFQPWAGKAQWGVPRTRGYASKKTPLYGVFFWRHHPDLNRGIRALQAPALPLGYGAVLERVTRLELATSTLARWRSTR